MERQKIWTVDDIKQVVKELDNITGLNGSNLQIKINGRLKRAMGVCKFIKSKRKALSLEFSKNLTNGNYSTDIVKKTIIHEYTHFLMLEKFKILDNHDDTWKYYCKMLGGDGEKYFLHKVTDKNGNEMSNYKYTIVCNCCGKVISHKNRLDKRYLNNYMSKCCEAELKPVQNY